MPTRRARTAGVEAKAHAEGKSGPVNYSADAGAGASVGPEGAKAHAEVGAHADAKVGNTTVSGDAKAGVTADKTGVHGSADAHVGAKSRAEDRWHDGDRGSGSRGACRREGHDGRSRGQGACGRQERACGLQSRRGSRGLGGAGWTESARRSGGARRCEGGQHQSEWRCQGWRDSGQDGRTSWGRCQGPCRWQGRPGSVQRRRWMPELRSAQVDLVPTAIFVPLRKRRLAQ
jgi:hypothetical protein